MSLLGQSHMYHKALRRSPKTRLCLRCTASCGGGQPCETQRRVCCSASPSEESQGKIKTLRLLMRQDAEVSSTTSRFECPVEV